MSHFQEIIQNAKLLRFRFDELVSKLEAADTLKLATSQLPTSIRQKPWRSTVQNHGEDQDEFRATLSSLELEVESPSCFESQVATVVSSASRS